MKGIMEDFLLFVVGIFVVLIILETLFAKGIAINILGFLAEAEPSYLQEDIRTFLIVATHSPGEFETKMKITLKHDISLTDGNPPTIFVETPAQFSFSSTAPIAFLKNNCKIVSTCTKDCGIIGDPCSGHPDCCGKLSCDIGMCISSIGDCGNGILGEGEECDPGNPTVSDIECPNNCTKDCICPKNYIQCNDNADINRDGLAEPVDNDGDGLANEADPECHTDYNAANHDSWDPHLKERKLAGESCSNDSDCWILLKCMSKVRFDKIGGTLFIKKYFENNECKLKIWKG
jgi:hypothetical protein